MKRSRLLETTGFNQLAAGRDGFILYNTNDMYIGRAIEIYGEYSGLEMAMFREICKPGYAVLEVGANIGSHTVGFSRIVGQQGRVLAFEPQRLLYMTLCANVALNSLTNVDCYWAALAEQEGTIAVPQVDPTREGNFGALALGGEQKGVPVPCFILDRYLKLPRINLIKIDVEGMEEQVLRGGQQVLQKFKPMLYVENDRVESSEALIRFIAGFGYRLFWHLPPLFNPDNYYGISENIFENIVSWNMLCVHRDCGVTFPGLEEVLDSSRHPYLDQN
jgi:FkbM family methyltransferase